MNTEGVKEGVSVQIQFAMPQRICIGATALTLIGCDDEKRRRVQLPSELSAALNDPLWLALGSVGKA